MLTPSELDTPLEPTSRRPPPRIVWWWQPRCWSVVGCALLVVAVFSAQEGWGGIWTSTTLGAGLIASTWGFAGVPTRELPWGYRLMPGVIMLAVVVPHWFPLRTGIDVACVPSPGRAAVISPFPQPSGTVSVVYDFGDGSSDSGPVFSEQHQYAQPGRYPVRVTVVQHDRSRSGECTVTVH